jgi:hypothetical protein
MRVRPTEAAAQPFQDLADERPNLAQRLKDDNRQIHAFQYLGDFCDFHQHLLPESNDGVGVAAMTVCSIGIIDKDLDKLIAQYPSLALALWRASMLEASISAKGCST